MCFDLCLRREGCVLAYYSRSVTPVDEMYTCVILALILAAGYATDAFGIQVLCNWFSMGGQVIWSCLKYIPHRLVGATLIALVVNYWWPSFPTNLSKEAYYQ